MPTHDRREHLRNGVRVQATTVTTRGPAGPPPPPAQTSALKEAAEALADTPPGQEVEALRCEACDGLFAEPGGAVFECSICGGKQVEENRCESCHIFMAKISEESCPDCEEDTEMTPVTAWEQDGELYESPEAAAEWEAGAGAREAEAAVAKARAEERGERVDRAVRERIRLALPRMRAVRERISPETAPRLSASLDSSLEGMEHGEPPFNITLYFPELARVVVPEQEDEIAAAGDRSRSFEDREATAAVVRERMLERVDHPEVRERMDEMFVHGTGLEFSAETATDALLRTMVGAEPVGGQADRQHPTKVDPGGVVVWMAHCHRCGSYEDDSDTEPPADYLCEGCQEQTE